MIRPMQPADFDEVIAIAAACPEAPDWQRSAYSPYLTPDPANPGPILRTALVALSSEPAPKIQAFAAATLLVDGEQNLCQLDSIAVHPDARRRALGSALLRALLAWAVENGAHHFSLEVRAGNAAALALYQRLGFLPEGRRPRYYTHPQEDALILGRAVTPDSRSAGFPR
ncbi:MAG TPA: GNAT family N-acetyltransferase [Acidobacteriaceae bacterium]|jgi:ribosomal-protein-alanine N-acetyltransferase